MTRWTRRLLIGAIAILVPALAGCEAGFNAPTLQFHPASNGANKVVDGITLDNVFVLGPAPGQTLPAGGQAGLFLALQAQNSDQLTSITASGVASSVQLSDGPISLTPGTLVDLQGPHPVVVLNGLTNPLSGGQTVNLTFNFANAAPVTIGVPVEPAAYDFATYAQPPTPTASASTAAVVKHKHKHKANASADPTTTP